MQYCPAINQNHVPLKCKHYNQSDDRFSLARGNTTVCGEFNFAADPEAAYIVLNEFICPIYIATWEFTCYSKLPWVRSSCLKKIYNNLNR